jgi:hypothetical protein
VVEHDDGRFEIINWSGARRPSTNAAETVATARAA